MIVTHVTSAADKREEEKMKKGHMLTETHNAVVQTKAGQGSSETHRMGARNKQSGGHSIIETQPRTAPAPTLDQIIGTLQQYSNIYERFVSANTKLILQLKAMARWYKIPGKEVDKILKGKGQYEDETQFDSAGWNGVNGHDACDNQDHNADQGNGGQVGIETQAPSAPEILQAFMQNALPFVDSLEAIGARREYYGKEIKRLARMLPVWPWVRDNVHGMGELRLGLLIGSTGDLTAGNMITRTIWRGDKKTGKKITETIVSYTNPAKVWKRMGMGVTDGRADRRIRRLTSFHEGAMVTPDENVVAAQEMGFNPRRRALMHMIGQGIILANAGTYRAIYDQRRAYEESQHPDWKPKQHPGHWHKRAMRYMEKRLLRDIWIEWNRIVGHGLSVIHPNSADKT